MSMSVVFHPHIQITVSLLYLFYMLFYSVAFVCVSNHGNTGPTTHTHGPCRQPVEGVKCRLHAKHETCMRNTQLIQSIS